MPELVPEVVPDGIRNGSGADALETVLPFVALLVGDLGEKHLGDGKGMAGGQGNSRRSNLLMRWRIGLQFLALVLFAILLLLMRQ